MKTFTLGCILAHKLYKDQIAYAFFRHCYINRALNGLDAVVGKHYEKKSFYAACMKEKHALTYF